MNDEYFELDGFDIKFTKIHACLPNFKEKEKYLKKIQYLRCLLQESKEEKIKEALSKINEEYIPLFMNIDEAIRIYELEIEFESYFKCVMNKDEIKQLFDKIKPKISGVSSSLQDLENHKSLNSHELDQ
jgi:CRISPR/Cas system-associated endoribonuclease Cas2